jgi:hypothetical protein
MPDQLWVDLVGDLIIARLRGEPNEELLRDCQKQVLFLAKDAERVKVLYDAHQRRTNDDDGACRHHLASRCRRRVAMCS